MKCIHVDCNENATVTIGLINAPACWKHAFPIKYKRNNLN